MLPITLIYYYMCTTHHSFSKVKLGLWFCVVSTQRALCCLDTIKCVCVHTKHYFAWHHLPLDHVITLPYLHFLITDTVYFNNLIIDIAKNTVHQNYLQGFWPGRLFGQQISFSRLPIKSTAFWWRTDLKTLLKDWDRIIRKFWHWTYCYWYYLPSLCDWLACY